VPRPHRRIDKSAARFVSCLAIEYPWCVDWDEYRAMAPQRDPLSCNGIGSQARENQPGAPRRIAPLSA
jgi:hypothetical protein